MSRIATKAFLCFFFLWSKVSPLCGFVNLRFNWNGNRFELLSPGERAVRCVLLLVSMTFTLCALGEKYEEEKLSAWESMIFNICIIFPYPLSICRKLLIRHRRITLHLNRVLNWIQHTEKLTKTHLTFSVSLYLTFVPQIFSMAAGLVIFLKIFYVARMEDLCEVVCLSLMLAISFQVFLAVYFYSLLVCMEIFCLRTMMIELNNFLDDCVENFNFCQEIGRQLRSFESKLRRLVRTYRRLVQILLSLKDILESDVVAMLVVICLACVYRLNRTKSSSVCFFAVPVYSFCLGNMFFAYTCCRRIQGELIRTVQLVEMIKLKPKYWLEQDVNCLLLVVRMAKLGLNVPGPKERKAFFWAIAIVFLKYVCNVGTGIFRRTDTVRE